jgi:2-amino-4-hydroxy-6-hydroxymethyldihydropteridine diphosphokinase
MTKPVRVHPIRPRGRGSTGASPAPLSAHQVSESDSNISTPQGVLAAIGLGANIPGMYGPPSLTVQLAAETIAALPGTRAAGYSKHYITSPVSPIPQPDFVNAVIIIRTLLTPKELLTALHALESQHGRNRSQEQRWGPRPLDCDLLLYGDTYIDEPNLRVPHPRMLERPFVTDPLNEAWPQALPLARRLLGM